VKVAAGNQRPPGDVRKRNRVCVTEGKTVGAQLQRESQYAPKKTFLGFRQCRPGHNEEKTYSDRVKKGKGRIQRDLAVLKEAGTQERSKENRGKT